MPSQAFLRLGWASGRFIACRGGNRVLDGLRLSRGESVLDNLKDGGDVVVGDAKVGACRDGGLVASACLPAELVDGGIDAVAADGNRGVGRLIAQGVAQIAAQFEDAVVSVKFALPCGVFGVERRPRAPFGVGLVFEAVVGREQQLLANRRKYSLVEESGGGKLFEVGNDARVVKGQGWHWVFSGGMMGRTRCRRAPFRSTGLTPQGAAG